MATLSHTESKHMYSWWWDSHISPKNSKWLQENLTDMDAKVKVMIKLINEDADSFARRAEMYYKKRPELMKLVEEFYRAYRALAERYDHATGVIRQAHRTMAEAFPNQVPLVLVDDSASEADPCTPEMSPIRGLLDHDDFQNDATGLSSYHSHTAKRNSELTEESDSITNGKGLKHINDLFGSDHHPKFTEGRVRKGLNFHEAEGNEQSVQSHENIGLQALALSESDHVGKAEKEIIILKEALCKLQAEKEAGLVQYQHCLDRVSKLESEVSHAQEDSRGLSERASKAEAEVQTLSGVLAKLEAEKEASLLQYQQCLDRITDLENIISHAQEDASELNQQVSKAESDAKSLREELAEVKAGKDAALDQYKQFLEMVSNLENKLGYAEEDAKRFCERAVRAEGEVETLKQAMAKLTEEKEAASLHYQQCLDTISSLESNLSYAQEEAKRLNGEIEGGVAKLKGVEERCLLLERSNQSLQSELESLVLKIGSQSQELAENQKEFGRLWTCIQEEHVRFMEAEVALQLLHSQAQEELRTLATELQNRAQILRDMEAGSRSLQDEILKIKEENKSLSDLNLSSAMSMKDMQNEICCLRETKGQLEQEVELQLDQRNALQQEIYCLKEELSVLNEKHHAIMEQLDAVGLNPDCLTSSVKELQEQMSNLKEIFQREKSETEALLNKLEVLEQLLEKNALLENSLSDLSAELEAVRGNMKALEESYQHIMEDKSTLLDEKSALISQLHVANENLEKLSEKNTILENSLSDVHDELEGLKERSKSLEDSCQVLVNQKASLTCERSSLCSQLDATEQVLNDLGKRYAELQDMDFTLEKEKESALCKVEELQISLDAERQYAQLCETRLAGMESQIHLLLEEGQRRKMEFEKELDKALDSQIENFILQRCVQDLEEKNIFLLTECQKLLEASKSSESLISELEKNNLEQQMQVKSLFDQTNAFRTGLHQLFNALGTVVEYQFNDKIALNKIHLNNILNKVEETKTSLCQSEEENQQLTVEMSILIMLLQQLILQAENLEMESYLVKQEFRIKTEQFSALQSEAVKLQETNEDLRFKLKDRDHKLELLATQIENLQVQLLDIQKAYQNLQKENSEILEEKRSLRKEFLLLEEKNRTLEEEKYAILGESLFLGNLSLLFENYVDEKSCELKELCVDLDELHGVNGALWQKLSSVERKLEEVQIENLELRKALQKLEHELKSITFVRDQLSCDIAYGKNLLRLKEMELLEAEQKLGGTENEKSVLHKAMEDMKRRCEEIKMIRDDQEKQILKLSEECERLGKENVCLHEGNQMLEIELHQLHEENEKTRTREQAMCSELQKGKDEIDMWETQAIVSFGELQIATICQALFEERVHELSKACKNFEEESTSNDLDIKLLKERVNILEGETADFKARLAAYGPAVYSLKDCISSLENKTCLHTKLQNSKNDTEDARLDFHIHESHPSRDQNAMACDVFPDFQDLQTRIKSIEKAVMEMERLMVEDNLNLHARLEAALKQIEEIKSENSSHGIYFKPTEPESGMTKDIMLDQISECSSYGKGRRGRSEADDQTLELWENSNLDGSIGLTAGKAKVVMVPSSKEVDYHHVEAVKKPKSQWPTSDILVEKDLGVDKLEISKRSMDSHQEGNKRRVLERLNSDVQKLTNLQITVQDLKRKLESTEKSKKGKATVKWETLKGQLEEAEEAILKLLDLNGKLTRNIEDSSFSGGKSVLESEDSESVRRRRMSEQVRKVSEKIGRLQLEVQKIQFVLLKLDDEIEVKGKSRIPEIKKRVLLRDYLYGGVRTSHQRKKATCCACIRPPTKGD